MTDTEQWLSNGMCALCRRKEYCKKICGAKKRAKIRFEKNIQDMMRKNFQDINKNILRAQAAAGAFERVCEAKEIPDEVVADVLDRCKKLAQVSNNPQFAYIEAHLENLHKGAMTPQDFMTALENANREQPYMGIDGKPIDGMMAIERRLQALENAYDESEAGEEESGCVNSATK